MYIDDEILSNLPFGLLVVTCKNKQNLTIEKCNNYIKELINSNFENLNCNHTFDRCAAQGVSVIESVSIKCANGHNIRHTLFCIPIVKNGVFEKIFCTVVPKNDSNNVINNFTKILTPREFEILELVLEGYTNKYIAAKLKISDGTVKKIIYNAYQKLGISSRIELAKMFM